MRMISSLLMPSVLACAAFIGACYTGPVLSDPYIPLGANSVPPTVEGTFDCASGVADVLAKCQTCHGAVPKSGAENPLVTRDQLAARSISEPDKTEAEVSLERMQNSKSPMPPTGLPSQSDISTLASWIEAGMPSGTCGGSGPTDPGTDPGTVVDPTFSGDTVCTSGKTYTGNQGNDMRPGEACNACHRVQKPSRIFAIAGTVYPTGHEPDRCVGTTTGDLHIVLTDSSGKETSVPVTANYKGNFVLTGSLKGQYKVRLDSVDGSRTRPMNTVLNLPNDGDCNTCHTAAGDNNAPGRIAAPIAAP